MTQYQQGYSDGMDKAIAILEKYKDNNHVLLLIIRTIKEAKKKELNKELKKRNFIWKG